MRERQRPSEQPDGVGSREPSVPSEIRRGERTVRLSNLDKPYWPEEGITKGDLLRYYRDVAPTLLPHLCDRPFTMKRYADGWQGRRFRASRAHTRDHPASTIRSGGGGNSARSSRGLSSTRSRRGWRLAMPRW